MYLRRNLEIRQGQLERIIDDFDRRKVSIESEEQVHYVQPDEYLRLVLEGKRGTGLREVVTSIQDRQNEIMRADPNQVLIVQGPAGSGKTTVALHRIAILLYIPENEPRTNPKRLMVIGSNRLYLRFISQVLPSINIMNIPQRTFVDWAASITGIKEFRDFRDSVRQVALRSRANPDTERANQRAKLKGSIQVIEWLKRLSDHFRVQAHFSGLAIYPVGRGSLGVFYTLTEHQINDIVEMSLSEPVNLQRDTVVRMISDMFFSQHEQNYRAWTSRMVAILNSPPSELDSSIIRWWEKRLEDYGFRRINGKVVLPSFRDGDQVEAAERRRERALRALRDEISELVSREFSRFSIIDVYLELLTSKQMLSIMLELPSIGEIQRKVDNAARVLDRLRQKGSIDQEDLTSVSQISSARERIAKRLEISKSDERQSSVANSDAEEFSLPQILHELTRIDENLRILDLLIQDDKNVASLTVDDIAPITVLHFMFEGETKSPNTFDHVIVDEAQDMSPLEMWILRRSVSSGSMTILGDLAQSIYSNRGVSSWDEFAEVFTNDRLTYEVIERTYRSTHEITTFANKVLQTRILRQFNYQSAEPFPRHGEKVRVYDIEDSETLLETIETELGTLLSRGVGTIAIISNSVDESRAIYRYILDAGYSISLVIDDVSEYSSEIVVISPYLVKGIEFDACIISNANREMYPADDIHGRLLYVAITRALHELVVMWRGMPSEHLPV